MSAQINKVDELEGSSEEEKGKRNKICKGPGIICDADHFTHFLTEGQTYSSISESKSLKRSLGNALMLLFAKDLETTATNQCSCTHYNHNSHIL